MDFQSQPRLTRFDEADRLKAIKEYPIDAALQEQLDRLARLAARCCDAPIGLVSIVGDDTQSFIGKSGVSLCGTPREDSFCAHCMLGVGAMVVPDASVDPRFSSNPLVTGAPGIRFYAGYPLVTPEGFPLGALCIIDDKPRQGLLAEEEESLATLAEHVLSLLERRRIEVSRKVVQATSQHRLAELEQRFALLADSLPQLVFSTPPDGLSDYFNKPWCDFTGQPADASYGTGWLSFLHPEDAPIAAQAWQGAVQSALPYEVRYRLRYHDGTYRWVVARGLGRVRQGGVISAVAVGHRQAALAVMCRG